MTTGTATCDYSTNPKTSEPQCYVSKRTISSVRSDNPTTGNLPNLYVTRDQCQATV
jgi:hypothetical protein